MMQIVPRTVDWVSTPGRPRPLEVRPADIVLGEHQLRLTIGEGFANLSAVAEALRRLADIVAEGRQLRGDLEAQP